MDRFEAQKAVGLSWKKSVPRQNRKRIHKKGHSERTGVVVEPLSVYAMVRQDGPVG